MSTPTKSTANGKLEPIAIPSVSTGVSLYTRKNAVRLATWDPALLWYAKAVAKMKSREPADPTSWIFQTAIHGFTIDPKRSESQIWTAWIKGKKVPSKSDQALFWDQCQHGTWYFLPWHRMYLGFFESIVRQTIVDLKGPADWALPYWDYNDGQAGWKLPQAFVETTLPDGTPNALYEPNRDTGNNGKPFLDAHSVSTKQAFGDHQFTSTVGGPLTGFGGPATNFQHLGRSFGALESSPHNNIHDDVGGLMGDPYTAAYDAIFWLHHSNIDRLWEVWLRADPRNSNPDAKSKWQGFEFSFNDGRGTAVKLKPSDILDSKTSQFHYQYEDTTPPAKPALHAALLAVAPMTEESIPEMVGASSTPQPLSDQTLSVAVKLFPENQPMLKLGAAESTFHRAHLYLENVRGKGRPSNYDIYFNIDETKGEPPEEYFVARLPMFGLEQASVPTDRHPGSGLKFTFNVTEVVNRLKTESKWNPEHLKVTFVPRRKASEGSSIEIGRVSLYYS